MADKAFIQVLGSERLAERFLALPLKLQNALLRKTLKEAAKPLLAQSLVLVPVGTRARLLKGKAHVPGTLKASLRMRAAKRSRRHPGRIGLKVRTGKADTLFRGEAFYGGFVEYGTEKMAPRAFLKQAAAETRGKVTSIARALIKQDIQDIISAESHSAVASGGGE